MKSSTLKNLTRSWVAIRAKTVAMFATACSILILPIAVQAQPTAPPATPTLPSANVDAVYNSSGTYTDISGVNYYESWGGWAGAGDYSIPPVVLGYQGVSYGGIDLNAQYDFSGYTYLHIDLYTPAGSSFAIRLVSATGQADVNYSTASGVIVPSTWVHLDIPLSQFTGLNLTTIHQLGLINNDAGDTGTPDYYLDNIYFYNPPPTPVNVSITSPTAGATLGNSFSITANANVYPGAVTNVSFYAGGTLLGKVTNSPFTLAASGVSAGAVALTAVAQDSNGNAATSSVVNITVTNSVVGAYEPFNYPSGAFANGTASTGAGFIGNWSLSGAGTIIGGLTYPSLPTANSAFQQSPGGQRDYETLSTPLASGTVYVSFLCNLTGNDGGNQNGFYLPGTGATSLFVGITAPYSGDHGSLGVGSVTTASAGATGVSLLSGASQLNGAFPYAHTNLIVLRIDFNTSGANDTVSLWLNPTAGTNSPAGNPAAPNPDLVANNYDVGTITGIGLNLQGGGNNFQLDEVRVGTTYGSVVGATAGATIPTTLALAISSGKEVSWTANNTDFYQPQSSTDGITWNNLGGILTGSAVTSVYDPAPVAYYQVLDITPQISDAVVDGGFELSDGAGGAQNWTSAGIQPPTQITTDFHTGSACMDLNVNIAPSSSEINQDVVSQGGSITGGNTYNFSFWAKQISSGVSYVANYKITWYDSGNNVIGAVGFNSFTGGNGTWTQISTGPITAPANAVDAFIQIYDSVGAVTGASGEVYIDDVSLTTTTPTGSSSTLTPTVQSGAVFTATVQTNGVTAIAAAGSVTFQTNSVAQSTGTVAIGVANSAPGSVPASYTLTAIYSGDSTYLGSTNILVVGGSNFGSGKGTVNLSGGNSTVVMSGVAGNKYSMERATNVTFTAGISNFPTATAPTGGNVTNVDNFSDLGAVPKSAFYRLQFVP